MSKVSSNGSILIQEKIIEYCTPLFMQNGFYLITVDKIAKDLRISKKTLYSFFPAKDRLVEAVAFKVITEVSGKIDSVINSDKDSLTKIIMFFEIISGVVVRFSDNFLKDLQIHAPELWQQIDNFRIKRAYTVLGSIIKQGQKEGIIINKPVELIIHMFISSIRSVVNPEFLSHQRFGLKEASIHSFEILFNGILTSKGRSKFTKIFPKVLR